MLSPFPALVALALGAPPAAAEDPPAGQRVFVCGHSFHVPIAVPLKQIALSAGIKDHVDAGKSILGGSSVTQHWEAGDDRSLAKAAIRQGRVDVLTLSPSGMLIPD